MLTPKDHGFLFDRRKFILTMFIFPLLASKLMADNKSAEINPPPNENGVVILGGWVLLKDDLIEKLV